MIARTPEERQARADRAWAQHLAGKTISLEEYLARRGLNADGGARNERPNDAPR